MVDSPASRVRATHAVTRWVYLRLLGAVGLVATLSFASQADGLVGSNGILPLESQFEELSRVAEQEGWSLWEKFRAMPTPGWGIPAGMALTVSLGASALGSVLLLINVLPWFGALLAFAGYLSVQTMGGLFTGYQWDVLLLETLFCALFLAPGGLRPGFSRAREVTRSGLFLHRALLFKVMFLSGIVKWTGGDVEWTGLTALTHHYWTQPLPNGLSWYVHHLPAGVHTVSVVGLLFVETVVPFALFAGRRARGIAFCLFAGLLGAMALTGSYGFFHLLTFSLCILALDDAALWSVVPGSVEKRIRVGATERVPGPVREGVMGCMVGVLVVLSVSQMSLRVNRDAPVPGPVRTVSEWLEPFHVVNSYGLFATMTTRRPEVLVEGSVDGETWEVLHFRFKPSRLDSAPRSAGLHMPRLDWQLWFAGLRGHCRNTGWYLPFVRRLLEGSPEVHALLEARDSEWPRWTRIRSRLHEYRFSTPEERDVSGEWWKRAYVRSFCPTLSLVEGRLHAVPDAR